MSCTIDSWTATASRAQSKRVLSVLGEGICATNGYSLHLEPSRGGIYLDPKVLLLRLVETERTESTQVSTPVRVNYETPISDDIVFVHIETSTGRYAVAVKSESRNQGRGNVALLGPRRINDPTSSEGGRSLS